MKKIVLSLSTILIGLFLIISCSKEDEITAPIKNLKLSDSEISVFMSGRNEVEIVEGNGGYKLQVSNKKVKANVRGGMIFLQGIELGKAVVKVTDAKKKTASVTVNVVAKDVALKQTSVTIEKNKVEEVDIVSGSGSYKVASSDETIAKATIEGNKVKVTALKKGDITVTVSDTKTSKKTTLKVTVTVDKLAISEEEITIQKGRTEGVVIKTGSGNYKAETKDAKVATVTLDGDKVIITGVKKGETKVVVTDTEGKVSKEIKVKVTVDGLIISKKVATIGKGEKREVVITSGSGNYKVETKDAKVATVTLDNNKVVITGVKKGETKVIVTDTEAGTKKEIKVVVAVDGLAISEEEEITVQKGGTGEFVIVSGSGNYKAETKDAEVATVTLKGTKITVTGVKKGKTKVIVTDTEAGTTKEVVVVVSVDKLAVSKEKVTILKGNKKEVLIIAGSGKYEVKSKDREVATVTFKGAKIVITGAKQGEAKVVVKDIEAGIEKEITVVVTLEEFTLSKEEVTVQKGEAREVVITSGSGDYMVKSKNNEVATVELDGTKIVITGVKKGEVQIVVTDLEARIAEEIKVVVSVDGLTVSKEAVTVQKGKTGDVAIVSGSGNYEVISADEAVATATLDGGNITISGVKVGETKVTVKDTEADTTKEIKVIVSVDGLTVSKEAVTVQKGKTGDVAIVSGSGNYEVVSADEAVATATLDGGNITISGVKVGETKVTVKDTEANTTKEIKVTVSVDGLTVSKEAITVQKGETGDVAIVSGSGNYEVVSADKAVATATLEGGNIIISGVKVGETKVTVKDTEANTTKEIAVTVSVDGLAVSKEAITVQKGKTGDVAIVSGSGNYEVVSADEAIATVALDGGNITISGIKVGETKVTVKDTEADTTKEIKVTVSADSLEVTETELTVREKNSESTYIIKGSGSYSVSSSDKGIATAVLEGNKVVITGVSLVSDEYDVNYKARTAVITVTDTETNATKEITVKVFKKLSIGRKIFKMMEGDYQTTPIVSGNLDNITFDFPEDIENVEIVTDAGGLPEIKITAKYVGLTADKENVEVVVKDGVYEKTVILTIMPTPDLKFDFSTNPSPLQLSKDQEEEKILHGSGKYEFEYDNTIIKVGEVNNSGYVPITGLNGGTTVLKITDKVTQQVVSVDVKVLKPIILEFEVDGQEVTPNADGEVIIQAGKTLKVTISGQESTKGYEGYRIVGWSKDSYTVTDNGDGTYTFEVTEGAGTYTIYAKNKQTYKRKTFKLIVQ